MVAPVFATGDVPTAAQVNSWFVNTKFAYKPTNETIASSTVLQSDDHLLVTVEANAIYHVEAILRTASQSAADLQIGWLTPASSSFDWIVHGINAGGSTTNDDFLGLMGTGSVPAVAGIGANIAVRCTGMLVTTAAAGTFRLQWAQNVSNASGTSVLANSYIFLQRMS